MYAYDIKINPEAAVLTSDSAIDALPGIAECLIVSKVFNSLDECETKMNALMALLSSLETKGTGSNHVVVIKRLPEYLEETEDSEVWEESTVLKSYVCHADKLKKSEFSYSVFARIRAVGPDSDKFH